MYVRCIMMEIKIYDRHRGVLIHNERVRSVEGSIMFFRNMVFRW